jgi:hypothetical protein
MSDEGPPLEALTHRMAECPADFLRAPGTGVEEIDIPALVADLLRDLGMRIPPAQLASKFAASKGRAVPKANNRLRLIAVGVWLLSDEWFLALPVPAASVWQLLSVALDPMAEALDASLAVSDPDRREELVRFCLWSLDLRPAGETREQAQDRLTSLDSVERVRVVRETRAAEERAQKIRQAMAEKAAREAASTYGRE